MVRNVKAHALLSKPDYYHLVIKALLSKKMHNCIKFSLLWQLYCFPFQEVISIFVLIANFVQMKFFMNKKSKKGITVHWVSLNPFFHCLGLYYVSQERKLFFVKFSIVVDYFNKMKINFAALDYVCHNVPFLKTKNIKKYLF